MVRLGQRELAKLAGIAVTTLVAFEREERPPFGSTTTKLRQALEDLGFSFGEDGTVRHDPKQRR